jgi:uncharacterized protein (UPF0333 family)
LKILWPENIVQKIPKKVDIVCVCSVMRSPKTKKKKVNEKKNHTEE